MAAADFDSFKEQIISCLDGIEVTAEPPVQEIDKTNPETAEKARQNRQFIYVSASILCFFGALAYVYIMYLPAEIFSANFDEKNAAGIREIPTFWDSYKAALGGKVEGWGKIAYPNIVELVMVPGFVLSYLALSLYIIVIGIKSAIYNWKYYNESYETGSEPDFYRDDCNRELENKDLVLALCLLTLLLVIGCFFFAWVFSDHPLENSLFPYLQVYMVCNVSYVSCIIILLIAYALIFVYHENRNKYRCDLFIKRRPEGTAGVVEPFNSTTFIN